MEKKEIIRDLLLILCVFVLFLIPWTSVFGVKNEALVEVIGLAQRSMGTFLGFILVLRLIYKTYGKSLHQEMKEEEIKEADQEDKKQLLFKPTIGVIIFFLLMILLGIWGFYYGILLRKPNEDVFFWIISSSFMIGISLWLWYNTPVFIFAEDSVQITSFLFYTFGIDRKTVIKYADITSVRPDVMLSVDIPQRQYLFLLISAYGQLWDNKPVPLPRRGKQRTSVDILNLGVSRLLNQPEIRPLDPRFMSYCNFTLSPSFSLNRK